MSNLLNNTDLLNLNSDLYINVYFNSEKWINNNPVNIYLQSRVENKTSSK